MSELWAAAITKPLAEEAAQRALVARGWRVYLPRYRKILRGHRAGRGEVVLRPLFPRYLFVEMQPQWSGVANVPGVQALVGGIAGDCWRPYTLSGEIVDAVRDAEAAGEFDEARENGRRCDLALGSMVAIPELADTLGRLMSLDDDGRAWVLIELLGRSPIVPVRAAGLVAAVA